MPTHHPHPPHSVPLTLATTTDRSLCCEKRLLEKMLKNVTKRKGRLCFPNGALRMPGHACYHRPPCPTHSHFTSCLLPFADLGLHYFPCLQPLPELEGYSFLGGVWNSLVAQSAKNLPAVQETWVQSLSQEDPLEKEMATHSSILA